ncbi:MAG: hypothetical protein ACR2MP_12250 [Streptosporangiaceae bacterium]
MSNTPSTSPADPLEAATRAGIARNIIAGFSLAFPALAAFWHQVDEALADVPALSAEFTRLNARLAACRLDRADLAAAGRASLAAYLDGEADPLAYLRDELDAQGFGTPRGDA